jgi:hypothetical protein
MADVTDLITQAAGLIGGLTQGTGLNASELADGFARLNILVDAWNADPLNHYAVLSEQVTLSSGVGSYTLGVGGSFSATRPVVIESANIILSGLKHPMDLINKAAYDAILEPTGEMTVPRKLYSDGAFPTTTIKIWPVPSGTPDLEINSPFIIPAFGALNSAVSLPPAYYKALLYTLAVDIAPSFRLQLDPSLPQIALDAQQQMKKPNIITSLSVARAEQAAPARGTATVSVAPQGQ